MTKHDTPKKRYEFLLGSQHIKASSEQQRVVDILEGIYQELMKPTKKGSFWKKKQPVQGVYLWGDVGVGKTFLLDLLYHSLPLPKLRQHYHVFMQEIQQRLFEIQGTKNPLQRIAKDYAAQYRVFFLDEFIVNDITNAMVLSGLLESIFDQGVCLITTSNIVPGDLYQYGFQREAFLPAIDHIQNNTHVINLSDKIDYRRGKGNTNDRYYLGIGRQGNAAFRNQFYSQNKAHTSEPWAICGRQIPVVAAGNNSAWFDFHVLCAPPRSQRDYIEISRKIKHLYLSNIPQLSVSDTHSISLFTKLIDVLYDEGIALSISAEKPVDSLLDLTDHGGHQNPDSKLSFEFERTCSRIIEMCSSQKKDEDELLPD